MKQTPIHFGYNPDILRIMPSNLDRVIEIGCSSGALAKAYTSMNPHCRYTGIEINEDYAATAKHSCSEVITANIEKLAEEDFLRLFPSDCWIFGDTLEHLYDPWALLERVRLKLAQNAQIIACIPNAQHWSVQARLASGQFWYENQGLMDRTHIRWFTRKTIIDLFESTGYQVIEVFPRIFDEPAKDAVLPAIRAMAMAVGENPEQAAEDALPLQWVVSAVPA